MKFTLQEDAILNEFSLNKFRRRISKTDEEGRIKVIEKILKSSYKHTAKRVNGANNKNIKEFMKTKGDFTKYSGYKDINDLLNFVNKTIVTNSDIPEDARKVYRTITEVKNILETKARLFRKGFSVNDSNVIILYLSLASSISVLTLKLITTYYEINNDGYDYKAKVIKEDRKLRENQSFKTLDQFLANYKRGNLNDLFNGKMDELLNEGTLDDIINIATSFTSPESILGYLQDKAGKSSSGTAKAAGWTVGVSAVLIGTIISLRFVITWVFKLRLDIASYLNETARVLEEMSRDESTTEATREKKKKYAERYRNIADKIDLDDSVANDRAEIDLEKEDKEIADEIDNLDLSF